MKAVTAAKTARKRNRKRKRRIASSSESSESSTSDSEDERPATVKLKTQVPAKPVVSEDSSSSSESSESESDSEPSSDEESVNQERDIEMIDASVSPAGKSDKRERNVHSRSPSPVPALVPSFLPTKPDGSVDTESEQQLKTRFRKFWMQSVADAFQDDLVQIHKVWHEVSRQEIPTYLFLPHSGTRNEQISASNTR